MPGRIVRQADLNGYFRDDHFHDRHNPMERARARDEFLDHPNEPLPHIWHEPTPSNEDLFYEPDDSDILGEITAIKHAFDIHKITDPINRGLDRMVDSETQHLQAPFKAITNYDEYVDPQAHQWNPATADDTDDSSFYEDPIRDYNFWGETTQERAKAKKHKELADMGRDSVEALGNMFHVGQVSAARYILLPHWDPDECVGIMNDHDADMNHHNPHQAALPVQPPTNLEEAIGQVGKDTEKFKVGLAVTPELMNQAKSGGFTLHDHVGDGPKNGYMVSLNKSSEQAMPMNQLTPELVQNYVHKNANALQDPNSYLGGWLDKGKFYLDVSHHVPDLNHATKAALGAHQLGIYDLNHGRTIDTDEAGWMTGNPQVVGRKHGSAQHPGAASVAEERSRRGRTAAPGGQPNDGWGGFAHHPDHDWTQHRLGTDEDWGIQRLSAAPVAEPPPAPAPPPPEPPPWSQLQNTGQGIGTHGGQVWKNPATQENWLVKPTPPGKDFLADADVAANHIAQLSGIQTPATFKSVHPETGTPASMQLMIPAKDAFPGHKVPEQLPPHDLLELQKHHALDWLLGNHDSHPGQYIRNQDGHLIGIDKAQSFKYSNQDKLNWNTHMNQFEPIHNTIWRRFATGGQELADPRQPGPLHDYVKGLQSIPDEELAQTITPYAVGAAKAGELGKQFGHPHLDPAIKFQHNNLQAFTNHMIKRKNSLMDDLGNLWDRAHAHRMTGTKVASKQPVLAGNALGYPPHPGNDFSKIGLAPAKTSSVYTVNLKLNDGSVDESLPVDEWPQAVAKQKAHDLAGKHGLTLKEMGRSPDDMGRLPLYMPAYRNDQYVGNAMIDRTENLGKEHNPYGPHADQYAYAAKHAAPTTPGTPALPSLPSTHPVQAPTLPKLPSLPNMTNLTQPKSPIPAGTEEPQQAAPMSGQHPMVGPSYQWKSEHNGTPDNFADDIQETKMLHNINPITGLPNSSGGGGGAASGSAAPGGGTPGMGTTPTGPGTPVPTGSGVPLVQKPDGSWTSSDPAWAHLINRESGGRNIIQSPSTQDVNSGGNEAFGLFQITPGTWSAHGGQGSVYNSTPQQQAQVAAEILRRNPSGSDWGAGLAGREDAGALARGLAGPAAGAQQ